MLWESVVLYFYYYLMSVKEVSKIYAPSYHLRTQLLGAHNFRVAYKHEIVTSDCEMSNYFMV